MNAKQHKLMLERIVACYQHKDRGYPSLAFKTLLRIIVSLCHTLYDLDKRIKELEDSK